MAFPNILFCTLLIIPLSGCGMSWWSVDGGRREGRHVSVGKNPEYGAYLLAQERLRRVRPGMSRGAFVRTLGLRRFPGEEWYTTFSGGDGWLTGLSRKNQLRGGAGDLIEEYSFGYHEGRFVVERTLVILRNGKVRAVLDMPRPEPSTLKGAPPVLREDPTREEENRSIRKFLETTRLTRAAFARAKRAIAKVRAGMTAGELRYHLGGAFYRSTHGYVYFADGFLWGPGFESIVTPTGSLTLMPFGYVEGGKEVQRFLIKIVDGMVTEIIKTPQKPAKPSSVPSG